MGFLDKLFGGLPGGVRHPKVPNVLYRFTPHPEDGYVQIDMLCDRCKGEYHWACQGGADRAAGHVANFATAHARCG